MGQGQSAANDLHDKKKEELAQMFKVLDAKREQFLAEVVLKRGKDISDKEVSGGRSVVRQSAIRVATQASPSQQIKKAIGTFFEAAQGGNKGKKAIVKGATQLVNGAIDAIFGVSKGSGMEKRGFTVLFLNFAFVRTDYFVYSYCAFGEKWGCQNSVSGSVQVTDMAVLDPATLHPMEIDYLIAQNITIDSGNEAKPMENPEFEALMQIKVMLATSAVLTRIMQDPKTDFPTLKVTMDQIRQIMDALAGKISTLPEFDEEETEKLLAVTTENWNKIQNGKHDEIKDNEKDDEPGKDTKALTKPISQAMAKHILEFIDSGCPKMEEVKAKNEFGYQTDPAQNHKGGSAYSTKAGGTAESFDVKKMGLGLTREQWNEPEKLIELFGAKFFVDDPKFNADDVKKSKYLIRPLKKEANAAKTVDANAAAKTVDPADTTPQPPAPIQQAAQSSTDEFKPKEVSIAEKKARAVTIKEQIMAQFKRNTYIKDKKKYMRYHDLAEFQKTGIKVLFGFEEAEWDTYYPSYKAPGRDEGAFDDRKVQAAWETW